MNFRTPRGIHIFNLDISFFNHSSTHFIPGTTFFMMDPRVWIRTPRSLCEGPNILYQDTICMKSAFSVCRFPGFCLFGFGAFSGLSGPPGSLARA
jgi:hypothetical protein